jgi:hypothetical protein
VFAASLRALRLDAGSTAGPATGAAAGLLVWLMGNAPTGAPAVDAVLLVVGAAVTVGIAANVRWWLGAGVAAVGAVLASSSLETGVGIVVTAWWILAARRHEDRRFAAAGVGGNLVLLAALRDIGPWGFSSLIGLGLAMTMFIGGALGAERTQRRLVIRAAIAVAAAGVAATAGFAAAAVTARPDLAEGNRAARQGLTELQDGRFDEARRSFATAAEHFGRADRSLSAWWGQGARLVPIISQHRNTGDRITSAAASASGVIAEQLAQVDLDDLRFVDGRIDIEAIRALREPVGELGEALTQLTAATDTAENGWLLRPVRRELADLRIELAERRTQLDRAATALDLAPALLGEQKERTYFVMFTTPAELRGSGGFMPNWAEITIDRGKVSMTAFGTDGVLDAAIERPAALRHAPTDWLARYGSVGFAQGPDRVLGTVPWTNVGVSPHFPSTAAVLSELYPLSGGTSVDGVISIDVYVMEALVALTGPIRLDEADVVLNGTNTAAFLLRDQYEEIPLLTVRQDQLETVALEVIDRLLRTAPPAPLDLGKALAPLADEGRVQAWAADPSEQELFADIGISGAVLPESSTAVDEAPDDAIVVSLNNAAGSKIDSFLRLGHEIVADSDGERFRLTLTNLAPATGYPDYVIGNLVGLPSGWSRLWVSLFSTVPADGMRVDGERTTFTPGVEQDLLTSDVVVDIGPGETRTVELLLHPRTGTGDIEVRLPPVVRP